MASAKGLVCGELSYRLSDDPTVIDCQSSVLIPTFCPPVTLSIVQPSPLLSYILIVEKHTIYNALLAHRYPLLQHCVLLTGKGFPCFSTRHFLLAIHAALPQLPVFALVDCDPHGLSIYATYKHGGARSSREQLALPAVQLLGLEVDEVIQLQDVLDAQQGGQGVEEKIESRSRSLGLQPLTEKDRRKVKLMAVEAAALKDAALLEQLHAMDSFQHKAEVEALESFCANYMTLDYLPWKVAKMMQAGGEGEQEQEDHAVSLERRRQEAGERLRVRRDGTAPLAEQTRSLSQ